MAFDIDQVAINVQCDFADIAQFSTKTLEDYSIVSRKHLEKIINNSERCLVTIICFYVSMYKYN